MKFVFNLLVWIVFSLASFINAEEKNEPTVFLEPYFPNTFGEVIKRTVFIKKLPISDYRGVTPWCAHKTNNKSDKGIELVRYAGAPLYQLEPQLKSLVERGINKIDVIGYETFIVECAPLIADKDNSYQKSFWSIKRKFVVMNFECENTEGVTTKWLRGGRGYSEKTQKEKNNIKKAKEEKLLFRPYYPEPFGVLLKRSIYFEKRVLPTFKEVVRWSPHFDRRATTTYWYGYMAKNKNDTGIRLTYDSRKSDFDEIFEALSEKDVNRIEVTGYQSLRVHGSPSLSNEVTAEDVSFVTSDRGTLSVDREFVVTKVHLDE